MTDMHPDIDDVCSILIMTVGGLFHIGPNYKVAQNKGTI